MLSARRLASYPGRWKMHLAVHSLRGFIPSAFLLSATLWAAGSVQAVPSFSVSTPYLSTANSTLNPLSPTYYVEDFEDGLLNIPGVTVTAIGGSGVAGGLSVDGDDGVFDGSGATGKQYSAATAANQTNTTFFFSPIAGQWPKQVAIAVTAGSADNLGFGVYDTNFTPIGGSSYNFSLQATSTDDVLITMIDNGGIGAIAIQSNLALTFMHYDHLQFDTAPAVPEPASVSAVLLGALLSLRLRAGRNQSEELKGVRRSEVFDAKERNKELPTIHRFH